MGRYFPYQGNDRTLEREDPHWVDPEFRVVLSCCSPALAPCHQPSPPRAPTHKVGTTRPHMENREAQTCDQLDARQGTLVTSKE
jgi:hypothetical protein